MRAAPSSDPHRFRRFALLAAGLAVVAGCTGGPVDPDEPSISSMLRLAPADADPASPVFVNLYAKAPDQLGVEPPAADASKDRVTDYYRTLFANEVDASGYAPSELWAAQTQQAQEVDAEFGYAPQALTADIYAGAPPELYTAAVGEVSGDRIAERAATSAVGDDVTTKEIGGVPVVSWLADNETDVENRHVLSQIGGSGRLAAPDDSALLYGRTDAVIEGLIGAYNGEVESLADNEDLVTIAEALDEHDVRAAALSATPVDTPPDGMTPEQLDMTAQVAGWIGSYRAYGVGVVRGGSDDGGDAMAAGGPALLPLRGVDREVEDFGERVVVVILAEEDTAAEVGDALERVATEGQAWHGQPWSELLSDPSIEVDGPVVTASFSVLRAQLWYQVVTQQDSLLFTGQGEVG